MPAVDVVGAGVMMSAPVPTELPVPEGVTVSGRLIAWVAGCEGTTGSGVSVVEGVTPPTSAGTGRAPGPPPARIPGATSEISTPRMVYSSTFERSHLPSPDGGPAGARPDGTGADGDTGAEGSISGGGNAPPRVKSV